MKRRQTIHIAPANHLPTAMNLVSALWLALVPLGVSAQELTVSEEAIRSCFEGNPQNGMRKDCTGRSANVCQGLPGGSTTIGISDCLEAETAVWDAILNEEYARVRDVFAETGGDVLVDSLRDAQRAWIAFRDADCGLAYTRVIGGTIRTVAYSACMMKMTADRAIALRDMRETF